MAVAKAQDSRSLQTGVWGAELDPGIPGFVWQVLVSLDNKMRRVYHKTCYASCIKTASLRIEMENPC